MIWVSGGHLVVFEASSLVEEREQDRGKAEPHCTHIADEDGRHDGLVRVDGIDGVEDACESGEVDVVADVGRELGVRAIGRHLGDDDARVEVDESFCGEAELRHGVGAERVEYHVCGLHQLLEDYLVAVVPQVDHDGLLASLHLVGLGRPEQLEARPGAADQDHMRAMVREHHADWSVRVYPCSRARCPPSRSPSRG